jgi:hypothetical protein
MKKWRKGKIVYIQGEYKARVVDDDGVTVSVVPLEGINPEYKGQEFTYTKDLLKTKRT